MPDHSRQAHGTNLVQRALAHPIRARILVELEKRPASPSQLAEVVGQSIGVVSYHVRVLTEAGLAELVGTVPKRGALQHFYAIRDRDALGATLLLDADSAEELRRDLRDRVEVARRAAEDRRGDASDVCVTVVVHTR